MKFIRRKKQSTKPTPKMYVEVTPKRFIKPKEKIKSQYKLNSLVLMSTLLIMTGLFCVSYNYIQIKKELAFDTISRQLQPTPVASSEEPKQEEPVEQQPQEEPAQEQQEVEPQVKYEYIGYLDIPSIKLSKGFLEKNSPYNNVDKNLLVLKESDYPDVEHGNLIIAGHSGTGPKAFFKYLYKLKVGDIAKVTYNGYVYTYKITNIEDQPKTGTITINRNYNKKTLTLITCTFQNNEAQTIYLLENIKTEKEGA